MALIKTKKLPNIALLSVATCLPYKIKIAVPKSPKSMPIIFLSFSFSLITIDDKISTNIGVVTIKTAPIMGEV